MDSRAGGNHYERHLEQAGRAGRENRSHLFKDSKEVGTREENEPKGTANQGYSKPEFRKRDTGSITGTGSRLNSQRATTNPIAAYQTCTSFIKKPPRTAFSCSGGVKLASTYPRAIERSMTQRCYQSPVSNGSHWVLP